MLPSSLSLLRKFSRATLTGQDFIDLCDLNHIELVISRDIERGFYFFVKDQHSIVLSTKLKRAERSFVGWHEFAHFLQNFYERRTIAAFSNVEPDIPSEKLADVFARIAIRPELTRITGPMDFLNMIMRGGK